MESGLIERTGTWLSFAGERLGQGRENARLFLKENTDIREKLEAGLRKQLGLANSGPAQPEKAMAQAAAAGGVKGRATR